MRGVSLRDRKRLWIVGIGLLSWLVIGWGGLPLWHRLTHLEQEASSSRQRVGQLQELLGRQSDIEQRAQAYARFSSADSEDVLQRRLLDELEQWAVDTNVQLNLKPKAIQREGTVSRLGIEVELDSSQEALLAFLDRLLRAPSLLELDRLQISATASKEFPLRTQMTVSRVLIRS